MYATAGRLIETAIPWLIERVESRKRIKDIQESRVEAEKADKLQRYERMSRKS